MKKHTYRHAKKLKESLEHIVHTEHEMSDYSDPNMPMGFVTRNGQFNSSYKIYISKFVKGESTKLHEYGHIIFQHLRYEKILENQTAEKVRKAWPRLKKYIEFDSKDFNIEDQTFKSIVAIIQNYAMDMEINSKIFDPDEKPQVDWETTVSQFEKLKYFAEKSGNNFAKKKLNDFLQKFKQQKKKSYLARLIWPDEYGFPIRLHWQSYVDLILQNPEIFLEAIKDQIRGLQNESMHQPRYPEKSKDNNSAPKSENSQKLDESKAKEDKQNSKTSDKKESNETSEKDIEEAEDSNEKSGKTNDKKFPDLNQDSDDESNGPNSDDEGPSGDSNKFEEAESDNDGNSPAAQDGDSHSDSNNFGPSSNDSQNSEPGVGMYGGVSESNSGGQSSGNPNGEISDEEFEELAKQYFDEMYKRLANQHRVADELAKKGGNPLKDKVKASDLQKLNDELDSEFNNEKAAEAYNPDGFEDVKAAEVPHHEKTKAARGFGHRFGILQKLDVTPFDKKVSQWIYERVLDDDKHYRTDYLYNYNRGKTDKVMRGHSTEYNVEYPSDCYILVDTSGSVGAITLNKLVKLFDRIKDQVGPKSKVIWWDTDLQRIDTLRHIKNAPDGGGTNLWPALKFINKFVKKDDKVFIVSDFYDQIGFGGDCYGVENGVWGSQGSVDDIYKNFKAQLYGIKWVPENHAKQCFKNGSALKKEFLEKLDEMDQRQLEYISSKMDVLCVVTD